MNEKKQNLALAQRLNAAAIHLLRRVRVVDEETHLTAPKLSALSVLVFGGPRTIGQLADAEQVRPPTMTPIVRELESAGLLVREVDKNDRRVSRVRATAKGIRLLRQGRTRRATLIARWLESLSPDDRRKLHRAIDALEALTRVE